MFENAESIRWVDLWETKVQKARYIIPSEKLITLKFVKLFSPNISDIYIKGLKKCLEETEYFIYSFVFMLIDNNKNIKIEKVHNIEDFIIMEMRRSTNHNDSIESIKNLACNLVGVVDIMPKIKSIYNATEYYSGNLNLRPNIKFRDISGNFIQTLFFNPITYKFTCKSLIQTLFNNSKNLNINDVTNVFKIAAEDYKSFQEKSVKLQIVEIAVNDGTTKDYILAVLTELIQNSKDAIKSTSKSYNKVNVDLYQGQIKIYDYVGMSNESLISVLIPFLSTKDSNDPNVTGEMGTGFFNVYRQPYCKKVQISTSNDNISITIQATPILDSQKQITDISYDVEINKKGDNRFTEILIELYDKRTELIQIINDGFLYLRNVMCYMDIDLYLNGESITTYKQLLYEDKTASLYIGKKEDVSSYVFTNGVPFSPLHLFYQQFPGVYLFATTIGSNRLILNFNKNMYTPTQSRTKVNISDENEIIITRLINYFIYLGVIFMYNTDSINFINGIVGNTTSFSPIDQLKFTIKNIPLIADESLRNDKWIYGFFTSLSLSHFESKFNTLGGLINDTIDYYINNKIKIYDDEHLKPDNYIQKISYDAVNRWFKTKKIESTEIKKLDIVDMDKVKIVTNIKDAKNVAISLPYLQLFINIYWNLLKSNKVIKLGSKLNPNPPRIAYETVNSDVEGYYSKSDHSIYLSHLYIPNINELNDEFEKLDNVLTLRRLSIFTNLFSPILPVTTFFHEILHSIQSQNHNDASHGTTSIFIGKKSGFSFDDTAIEINKILYKEGLLNDFVNSLQDYKKLRLQNQDLLKFQKLLTLNIILADINRNTGINNKALFNRTSIMTIMNEININPNPKALFNIK